jgi:hypothetical protein
VSNFNKVKLIPCAIKHDVMKAHGGEEVQLHAFLNLGLRWRRVDNFVPAILTAGRAPCSHWIGWWVWSKACLDILEKDKILFRLPGIENRFFGRPARNLDTITTERSQLDGSTRVKWNMSMNFGTVLLVSKHLSVIYSKSQQWYLVRYTKYLLPVLYWHY